jgi:hypothetical protein
MRGHSHDPCGWRGGWLGWGMHLHTWGKHKHHESIIPYACEGVRTRKLQKTTKLTLLLQELRQACHDMLKIQMNDVPRFVARTWPILLSGLSSRQVLGQSSPREAQKLLAVFLAVWPFLRSLSSVFPPKLCAAFQAKTRGEMKARRGFVG